MKVNKAKQKAIIKFYDNGASISDIADLAGMKESSIRMIINGELQLRRNAPVAKKSKHYPKNLASQWDSTIKSLYNLA